MDVHVHKPGHESQISPIDDPCFRRDGRFCSGSDIDDAIAHDNDRLIVQGPWFRHGQDPDTNYRDRLGSNLHDSLAV